MAGYYCCFLSLCVGLVAVMAGYYFFRVDNAERCRFDSFVPVRDGASQVKWLVDGQDYMSAVADAIASAKYEIFITDWQIHPHVHMKRHDKGITSLEWRLDKLLLRKAEEGVRVYILLYWETKRAMDLGSDYAVSALSHPNIEIHRHPTLSTLVRNPTTLLRWSHHEKVVIIDRSIAFVGGIDLCLGRWDTHAHPLTDNYFHHPCVLEKEDCTKPETEEPSKRYCRWVGKDYGNTFLAGGRTGLGESLKDIIHKESGGALRDQFPRMPWHDVACMFNGIAAKDVARHFIQRYNAITTSWWAFWEYQKLSLEHWNHPEVNHSIPHPCASNARIQVLRSVGSWSASQPHEDSIHKAYIHAITHAEHFIYIENQFFISSQPKELLRNVQNEIQSVLSERIARAYMDNEDFHVMIILPLQPEFPGEWGKESGKDLAAVSYWNYVSLYSGENSLFSRLKRKKVPATSLHHYVSVYGLRTHGTLSGEFVTELIYVHSKVMIVDDRLAIIGSANINDRSMLGDRDSEVNVLIEDQEMIEGKMNGEPYTVGKFSHGLRCHLLKEHLGLLDEGNQDINCKVEDPVAYNFYKGISDIAVANTLIYEQVFRRRILPTNQVWNYEDLENWKTFEGLADILPEGAREELSKIRGHIVNLPLLFLKDVLKPSAMDYLSMYVDNRGRTSELDFSDGGRVFV